ncbi:molybdopterin synthase catalytic subunit MoaE [Oceanicella actignis]|uniref:Molybdopterin synthase catalytic subunit n=1 Tax=Oceanicella actignis TaxID=1189325 RepID=A0A1M7TSL5_9RHOB|nr:molybdopterin synthase catalytic subunit MoaE [Oceanicella actignis]TYO85386.1 molybdopterin synthase catalytic subunit [Oceanicella actignis]SET76473.1 molybdopterin synthase subunit MoaE [Oceanicella actignis]SHN73722.1 molybdopterin synthase catalytic subunit [Oceanicella actignis]
MSAPEPAQIPILISVQEADFDVSAEIDALTRGRADVGAVACFVGLVRDVTKAAEGAPVMAMTLEHYPGMTEKSLEAIAREAARRWPLLGVRIVHRVGRLAPADRIVLAAAASAHRGAAFEAAEFLMDYLKTRAPFWKKEETPDGARWVDARESDEHAAARWER